MTIPAWIVNSKLFNEIHPVHWDESSFTQNTRFLIQILKTFSSAYCELYHLGIYSGDNILPYIKDDFIACWHLHYEILEVTYRLQETVVWSVHSLAIITVIKYLYSAALCQFAEHKVGCYDCKLWLVDTFGDVCVCVCVFVVVVEGVCVLPGEITPVEVNKVSCYLLGWVLVVCCCFWIISVTHVCSVW